MDSDDCDEINLIGGDKVENDCYCVKLIKDTNNKINSFLDVKLEFSDHLCIHKILKETEEKKLLYEISYYNIVSWLHGKNQFGINYKNYNETTYQLMFQVENDSNMVNSIRHKVNELLEYTCVDKRV